MTAEERFERIEHVTAGLVEQAKLDREENRTLWRDTQRQIGDLTGKLSQLTARVDETNTQVGTLAHQVDRLILHAAERDSALQKRIDGLVSAIGDLIKRLPSSTA